MPSRDVISGRHLGTRHLGTRHLGTRHLGTRHLGTRHLGTRHLGTRPFHIERVKDSFYVKREIQPTPNPATERRKMHIPEINVKTK